MRINDKPVVKVFDKIPMIEHCLDWYSLDGRLEQTVKDLQEALEYYKEYKYLTLMYDGSMGVNLFGYTDLTEEELKEYNNQLKLKEEDDRLYRQKLWADLNKEFGNITGV